jgi:hypothetical protein
MAKKEVENAAVRSRASIEKNFAIRPKPERERHDGIRVWRPAARLSIQWRKIMSKTLFAGLLAGALLVPQAAVGNDAFRLPSIPYVQTIPWLTGGATKAMPSYLGLLLDPRSLAASPIGFAAAPAPSRMLLSTQLVGDAVVSTQ